MNTDFTDAKKAEKYLKFSSSEEGQKQHSLIWENLEPRLPQTQNSKVLDIGCGNGWLADMLKERFNSVKAVDSSGILLAHARQHYPQIEFSQADLMEKLPFADQEFDLVTASLVMHDLKQLESRFQELKRLLKPGGKLLIVELNPYYAHPVGSWKRNFWQKIMFARPKLKVSPYGEFRRNSNRLFTWRGFQSFFYTLPEFINNALKAGFTLNFIDDLIPAEDSKKTDLLYRSYRFPVFVILEFINRI